MQEERYDLTDLLGDIFLCPRKESADFFLPKLENEPPNVILNMTFYKLYTKTGREKKPVSELVFLLIHAQFEHATFIKTNSEGNIHG